MSVSPAEVPFSEVETGRDELLRLMDLQRRAFGSQPMPSYEVRVDRLNRLRVALLANREKLIAAINDDFGGRSRLETEFAEIMMPLENIRYLKKHIKKWMKPQRRRVGLLMASTSAKIHFQPLGVTGIVAPWNFPVYLAVQPLSYALAAGNRVMLKLSEITPRTSEATRAMLAEAFSDDEVVAVTGGVETAKQFVDLPFDHLLFTGSTVVGRQVMKAAANNLTPVTLELGGKSPVIIGPEADVEMAAERICFGKSLNSGQICLAPDYLFCPADKVDQLERAIRQQFAKMYPHLAGNPEHTCIINKRHARRLEAWIEDAKEKGARVEVVNPAGEELGECRMALHLVFGVTDEMKIMQEEIFVPLLPVMTYRDLGETIAYVNSHPRPLALYLFDHDKRNIRRILSQTHSGGACVNDTIFHIAIHDMPFGGVGSSGMGAYQGREGFLTFSHAKGVLSRPRLNFAKAIYAPRSKLANLMLRFFAR